ncbi:MAG: hypothetical protein B7L53_05900 [Thermofilum sp. NZ13]|nr:MAG: hypothetical protein B7L53_05900 [Thermofilum sp. NZ13]
MPEERRWYRDPVNWLTIAVLVGFTVAVVTSPTFQSWLHSLWGAQPQQPQQQPAQQPQQQPAAQQQLQQARLCSVLIEADAPNATALVNGTLHALPARLTVREGSLLVIEPQPTVTHEPLNSSVTVKVTGNATVVLRYRRAYALVRTVVSGPGQLIVNGTPVGNATLRVRPGTLLEVLAVPDLEKEAELYVNGSKLSLCATCSPNPLVPIEIRGDTELVAVFGPKRIVLHVDTGNMSVLLKARYWEQWVNGTATIGLFAGDRVNVTTFCVPFEDALRCVVSWAVSQYTPLGLLNSSAPPNATISLHGDAWMRAVVSKVKSGVPSPVRGGVLMNGSEVPATMMPTTAWQSIRPWTARYEYLGNGVWRIDSSGSNEIVLDIGANWSKLKVELFVEDIYPGRPFAEFNVLTEPYKGFFCNYCDMSPLLPGDKYVVVFDRSGKVLQYDFTKWCAGTTKYSVSDPVLEVPGRLVIWVKSIRLRLRVEVSP